MSFFRFFFLFLLSTIKPVLSFSETSLFFNHFRKASFCSHDCSNSIRNCSYSIRRSTNQASLLSQTKERLFSISSSQSIMQSHQEWMVIGIICASLVQIFMTVESFPIDDKITSLPGQPQVSFQQFSGYITVDEKQNRALFYYFVEAESQPGSKPLVLWLNGGKITVSALIISPRSLNELLTLIFFSIYGIHFTSFWCLTMWCFSFLRAWLFICCIGFP